jgi:hypothetical protein
MKRKNLELAAILTALILFILPILLAIWMKVLR